MNCQAVYSWLLEARSGSVPPREIKRHLEACGSCRERHKRLRELEVAVQHLETPPPSAAARRRLDQRLAQTPPPSSSARRRPPYAWMAACAAMLLIGVGLGTFVSSTPQQTTSGKKTDPKGDIKPPPADLLAAVAGHDVRLATTFAPQQQVEILTELADDLHAEALHLSSAGRLEDLPMMAELYGRVLEEGLVQRAAHLTPAQRTSTLPELMNRLQRWESQSRAATKKDLPAVGNLYQRMSEATGRAADAMETGRPGIEPRTTMPVMGSKQQELLPLVVDLGLRVSRADDPLVRADIAATASDQLVQSIVLASADQHSERAAQLAEFLGKLVDQGVTGNLERVRASRPDAARRAEIERIENRVHRAVSVLERNLEKAPAPARFGLQQALDATRGKNGGGQRKGPPDFKDFVPPGLRKGEN